MSESLHRCTVWIINVGRMDNERVWGWVWSAIIPKSNFLELHTFTLWPGFEAQKSFLEFHNNGDHLFLHVWPHVALVLTTFQPLGSIIWHSEAPHLTFPLMFDTACRTPINQAQWYRGCSHTISTQLLIFLKRRKEKYRNRSNAVPYRICSSVLDHCETLVAPRCKSQRQKPKTHACCVVNIYFIVILWCCCVA